MSTPPPPAMGAIDGSAAMPDAKVAPGEEYEEIREQVREVRVSLAVPWF